ncbi:DUF2510 domain-containing protein [Nocardioides taihuensis]|uniref:DUF2510 domain-containing protein n=1 Tax=Nocardioides taihuensis TaxID=1835606 RepID=A0ABW0BMF6_9ACTN
MSDHTPLPAGWYPHPTMADTQQYWDGTNWTGHIAPRTPTAVSPAHTPTTEETKGGYTSLEKAGLVTGFLFPIIGFVCGVVVLTRGRVANGVGIMILSLVAGMFWYSYLADQATTDSHELYCQKVNYDTPAC